MLQHVSHHTGLFVAYACATASTFAVPRLISKRRSPLYPAVGEEAFSRPWREFGLALLSCLAIVMLGSAYSHGWKLAFAAPWRWVSESLNQMLIFSPMPALLLWRKAKRESVFAARDRNLLRLLVGVCTALIVASVYAMTRGGLSGVELVFRSLWSTSNVPHVIQVLLEDITVICLLTRLGACLGSQKIAGIAVMALFVLAHIPPLIAAGAFDITAVGHRALDLAVGVVFLTGVLRTRDVLWIWPIHSILDLTQFVRFG